MPDNATQTGGTTNKETSSLRVALLGCGRIAQKHAALLGEGRIEGARLCAVCDIVRKKARELSYQYNVPWFNDWQAMMVHAAPDVVAVLTPSGEHEAHVLMLAPYGVPLLVEKPLTLTLDGLQRVTDACQHYGTRLGEVKQNRYNLAVRHLKTALDFGRLGDPHMASVRVWWSRDEKYYRDWHGEWSQAGGVLANQTIHHVDLLVWLLGPVEKVSAIATYSGYTDVETGLCATLEFKNGCIGTLEASALTRPKDLEGSLAILGDKGTVELGGFAVNKVRRWLFDTPEPQDEMIKHEMENPPNVYGLGHKKLYEDVVDHLQRGAGFPVSAEDAGRALEVVHACYQSMETGQPVKLGGEYPASRLGR